MKHVFHLLSKVPYTASLRTARNPADMVRLLVFLTNGTLFLPAIATATSVVALIDNINHRVVIAADCCVNRQLASLSQCKIIDKPGCTVAMAGRIRISDLRARCWQAFRGSLPHRQGLARSLTRLLSRPALLGAGLGRDVRPA